MLKASSPYITQYNLLIRQTEYIAYSDEETTPSAEIWCVSRSGEEYGQDLLRLQVWLKVGVPVPGINWGWVGGLNWVGQNHEQAVQD